jgi:hypothetical protein
MALNAPVESTACVGQCRAAEQWMMAMSHTFPANFLESAYLLLSGKFVIGGSGRTIIDFSSGCRLHERGIAVPLSHLAKARAIGACAGIVLQMQITFYQPSVINPATYMCARFELRASQTQKTGANAAGKWPGLNDKGRRRSNQRHPRLRVKEKGRRHHDPFWDNFKNW